jgi:hypothetical protein
MIIAATALGTSLAGGALSAYGQYRQGEAQNEANEYNANMSLAKADQEERESREKLKKLMGTQRVLYAKAGVDLSSGSPLMVLANTAAEGEEEALNIRARGQNEANMYRWYGKQAKKGANISAGSTFLTSLGQAGTQYASMSGPKIPSKGPSLNV